MQPDWQPDILGNDYFQYTMQLPDDDEGAVFSTLVKYQPDEGNSRTRVVLYIHGWSDYFFQKETAEFWHRQGARFYAIDLKKYGRSLREWQTPGYVTDLAEYSIELKAAFHFIRKENGANCNVMIVGHSTGGLVAALWMAKHPGFASALVLNSPWLELQGTAILRAISAPGFAQLAKVSPKFALPNVDGGFYKRASDSYQTPGTSFDLALRPSPAWPGRPGWLQAIMAGHAQVAEGLQIAAPILLLISTKTHIGAFWHDDMMGADTVLDVQLLAQRAVRLGNTVTISQIPGGLHDLALSAPEPRAAYYQAIFRWLSSYGWPTDSK